MRNQRRDLTLIELIIVVAIIAIVASILFPMLGGGRDAKRAAAIRAAETFGFTGIQLNDPSSGCGHPTAAARTTRTHSSRPR